MKKIMSHEEIINFIDKLGRTELYQEIDELEKDKAIFGLVNSNPYPVYLKAIIITLVSLDYDEEWVYTTFKKELNAKYLKDVSVK